MLRGYLTPGFLLDNAINKMSETHFDLVMKIHNYVPFRLIKALAPHWMDSTNRDMPKAIINISSVSGLHGAQGQVNYCTAKAGVLVLTMAMAKEWSRYAIDMPFCLLWPFISSMDTS